MTSFYPAGRMNRAGSSWHDPARPILLTSSKTSKTESINQSINQHLLVALGDGDVRRALSGILAAALKRRIVSNVLDVSGVASEVAAQHVARELASTIAHRPGPGEVRVRGSQPLLVVQLGVGLGLGKQILGQVGVRWSGAPGQ